MIDDACPYRVLRIGRAIAGDGQQRHCEQAWREARHIRIIRDT
jgi:hypothetical protein